MLRKEPGLQRFWRSRVPFDGVVLRSVTSSGGRTGRRPDPPGADGQIPEHPYRPHHAGGDGSQWIPAGASPTAIGWRNLWFPVLLPVAA